MPTADVTSSSRPRARSASKYLKPPPRLDFLFFLYFFILKPSLSPGNKTTALPLQPICRTLPHAASIALPLAGVHHFHQFTCCLHQVVEEESHLPTCNVPSRPALQLRIHRDQSGDIHGADTDACQDAIRQTTTT